MKPLRVCRKCGLEAYTLNDLGAFKSHRGKPYDRATMCKQCDKDRRFSMYGINEEIYNNMLEEQEGRCLLCDVTPTKTFHIDHCHTTGKVRGLLCQKCNHALGLFQDSPHLMRKAAAYVSFWKEED